MSAEDGRRMSLAKHFEELRVRLLRSILVLLGAVAVSFLFYRTLVDVATLPHFRAMEWCGHSREHTRLRSGTYTGCVLAAMKLTLITAFFVASPLIAREAWAFVAAGLHPRERTYVVRFAPVSFLLFVLGAVFGYFILIPYALYGMVQMMPPDKILPLFDFAEYVGLVLTLTILLGAVFQLPLVMVFLTSIGIVQPPSWSAWRRHAVVANVLLAAVLSPPDLLSMLVFAVPLLALYEIGAAVSRWAHPRDRRA
jgi:sec-independent protein translocase protein TatC